MTQENPVKIRDISKCSEFIIAFSDVLNHIIKEMPGQLTLDKKPLLSVDVARDTGGGVRLIAATKEDSDIAIDFFDQLQLFGGIPLPVSPWLHLPPWLHLATPPDTGIAHLFTDPKWTLPLIVKKGRRNYVITSITVHHNRVAAIGVHHHTRGGKGAKGPIKCPDGKWRSAKACSVLYPADFDTESRAFRPGVTIPAFGVRLKKPKPAKLRCPDGEMRSVRACIKRYDATVFDPNEYRFLVEIPGPKHGSAKRIPCADGKRRWKSQIAALHPLHLRTDAFNRVIRSIETGDKQDAQFLLLDPKLTKEQTTYLRELLLRLKSGTAAE